MAKQITQFRYYGPNNSKNYPQMVSANISYGSKLISGNLFSGCRSITQLGIQTIPGVRLYLNNSLTPIIIGATGIYELDLEGLTTINNLHFDKTSVNLIDSNANAYLIIDLIYDDEGVK